jgi:Cd2+/Zn2+-exporting ATPase
VSGIVEGKPARLGTYVFVEELIPVCLRARVAEVLGQVQQRGDIATTVAWNDQAGVLVLSDQIRPGAPELVQRLHALGVRPVCMLTGDNEATARHVATELGLDEWHAEMLPADKVAAVERLKHHGNSAPGAPDKAAGGAVCVGVIGDGVNDAPALAAADVSIAIGSIGSDAALESADIVLLSDDLSVVPWAVRLARRTRKTIAANLIFSLSAILIMAVGTLVGSRTGHPVPLWAGVLGHEGGTLLVVFNSLALLGFSGPNTRTVHPAPRASSSAGPARMAGTAAT